jgi:formylglycine-generating enzyme required for sulfatase activity
MHHRTHLFSAAPLLLALTTAVRTAEPDPGSEVYFNQFVRPILESSCTHCHGKDKAEGDLRLDSLEACLKGVDGRAALVPGKPEESTLYSTTVLAPSHDDIMPPSKEPPLVKGQTEKLNAWITAGAKWPAGVELGVEPRMQFVRDIQPILEQNCVSCHKADKNEGGLDMTTIENNLKGGDSGAGLVPFNTTDSLVLTRTMLPEDDDDLMPPKKKGGPLRKEELQKLQLWVKQGAPWPEGVVLVQKAKTEERPPSPDSLELVKKIHGFITEKSTEKAEADMKPYTASVSKAGKEFGMVVIPGGEFTMGSPGSEKDRKPDEGPQVKVKIEPFWMGSHEVTWDLYMSFMLTPDARWKDGAKKNPKPDDTIVDAVSSPTAPYTDMTFGMGQDGFPAISMTEHAASKFCQWLSAQTGHFYRLPTEAEWEYAARAGKTTTWFWGDDASPLGDYAWFFDNSDGKTQLVGKKKPSPWGLYDIYGNVAEWTLDQYDEKFYGSIAAGALNPFNQPKTIYPRVVRGGSWDDDPKDLRSAARRFSRDTWKQQDPQLPKSIWYHTNAQFLGFRIVRPLNVPPPDKMHLYWNLGLVNEQK